MEEVFKKLRRDSENEAAEEAKLDWLATGSEIGFAADCNCDSLEGLIASNAPEMNLQGTAGGGAVTPRKGHTNATGEQSQQVYDSKPSTFNMLLTSRYWASFANRSC